MLVGKSKQTKREGHHGTTLFVNDQRKGDHAPKKPGSPAGGPAERVAKLLGLGVEEGAGAGMGAGGGAGMGGGGSLRM